MIAPTPKTVPSLPRLQSSCRARAARQRGLVLAAALLGLVLAAVVLPMGAERAGAFGVALRTGVDTSPAGGVYEHRIVAHIRESGAQFMKLAVNWNEIAPANPPPGFDPSNPDSPGYRWEILDEATSGAVAEGLTPFFTVIGAPPWGESPPGAGEERPDSAQLAVFARALALRYNGLDHGLPRVRYYEVWNEPNVSFFLQPQLEAGRYVSVDTYRTMVNRFAAAVHGVRSDNLVIAGALFPNGLRRKTVTGIAALEFTRRVLCMSAGSKPKRVCDATTNADIWSVHPYTSGGPSTRPANPDNVWIYNMGALTSLIKAAQRAGTLISSQPVHNWVTEFGWDSKPPDPLGVPLSLQQRWVAEALYQAWKGGVSVFTWYALRDDPLAVTSAQAGLYFYCAQEVACDQPKPAQRSFRFPFVAFKTGKHKALLWGRVPFGVPGKVRIQWRQGSRWRLLTTLRTDSDGIFTATRKLPSKLNASSGVLRALAASEPSPPFSLHHPPDIIVTPFGI